MSAFRLASISCALLLLALAAAGCGGQQSATSEENLPAASAAPSIEEREAELAAREKELELQEKAKELERREAALAGETRKPASRPASKPAAPAAPATSTAPASGPAASRPEPVVLQVPAGTELSVELSTPLSTKTTTVGTPIEGRLASDVVVDGRRVAAAGAMLRGTVTSVVSAKKKIGGRAKLGLAFDSLELASGQVVPIAASTLAEGKSSTAADSAKIGGGAAAGAILGHQIDDDKGKVIGGIVGGALGTLAATTTGAELELPAGTVLAIAIENAVEVRLAG